MKGKSNSSKKKTNTTKKVTTTKKEGSTKQNVIVAGLILVILICVFFSIKTIVNSGKKDEKPRNDNAVSEEVLKDTKVGNLSITNARLVVQDGVTSFMATATNETESDYHVNVLYVTFTSGNTTRKIPVLSDITIRPNEHTPIALTLDSDISDTTKIDYDIK